MAAKLIFITGAPEASSLSWGDEVSLLTGFEESIARFARLDDPIQVQAISENESTQSSNLAYWRSIPLARQHLATGLSQTIWKGGAQFFATSLVDTFHDEYSRNQNDQAASFQSVEEVLTQFYEESYAVHRDIPSSQIDAVSQQQQASDSFATTTSYDDNTSFNSLASPHPHPQPPIPFSGPLHNLKEIPSATYLSSINPQTMTVNLIVGLISVPSPRNIHTKRGAAVQLIELIVGDESKTGFGVNFWLPADAHYQNQNQYQYQNQNHNEMQNQKSLGEILRQLRPQDVVLMRNVALSSFRGRVYGQSLRKDVTKVHLLWRRRVDRLDMGGCYRTGELESDEKGNQMLEKTRRVKEWVQKFVGGGTEGREGGNGERYREVLPPDSLPSQD